jgi:hypothetical protein
MYYFVPTLEALPALAKDAVLVVDDRLSPIAALTIVISSNIDRVLMTSRQKKKPSKYPLLVITLITCSYLRSSTYFNSKKS